MTDKLLKCPACENTLGKITVHGVELDVCENGCGGIWFDAFELKKFDEIAEDPGPLLDKIPKSANPKFYPVENKRSCPRCEGVKMMRHYFNFQQQVQVDECPKCAGIWLDDTELATIRGQYDTELHRKLATEEFAGEVFRDASMEAVQERNAHLEKARKFAQMFKALCPSAYIPGKQKWGAF